MLMVVYSNSISFCGCIDYWHFSIMTSVVHVPMCLLYLCLVLLSKSAESFFLTLDPSSSPCVCLREKQYCSSTPPCSVGLDEFLMAQLDPSASCPHFTPVTHTRSLPLFISLSLWSGLGQGQCKNRVHKDDRKDVSVCVSESTCCRWCAIFTTLNSSLRCYICF